MTGTGTQTQTWTTGVTTIALLVLCTGELIVSSISVCKTSDLGRGHFWTQGYNLNNLGRGPLGEDYSKYQRVPGLLVSDKKIFKGFLYTSLCKTCQPQEGAIFDPRAITNNFGRCPLGEAMYQISKAWAFCFQTRRFLSLLATASRLYAIAWGFLLRHKRIFITAIFIRALLLNQTQCGTITAN